MKLFDAHCHLQMPQFDQDRSEVLARMQELEMGGIIVGTDYEISKAAVELAQQHDFLWASVGLHPNDNESEHYDISKYEELARDPKVVAIGECGLDYFRSGGTEDEKQKQKAKFAAQIELAKKLNKALIIHCRPSAAKAMEGKDAHDDCSRILENMRISVPVVIHFFTGTRELAQKYLDLGCYLSFPGPITFTDMYDESIRVAPLDKILVETDSPFAAPVPYRGKRNEPAYVLEVARKIATLKGLLLETVTAQVVQNAHTVFKLH